MGSNGEDPITEVRGADGCCGDAIPDDTVPERGQVPENLSPDSPPVKSEDVGHILDQDVAGSKLANGSPHLSPQNGLGMVEPVLLACAARALAGEAAGEEADRLTSVSSVPNIVKDSDSGPALGEDVSAPRVPLAEPSVFDASEVEAVVEQADS